MSKLIKPILSCMRVGLKATDILEIATDLSDNVAVNERLLELQEDHFAFQIKNSGTDIDIFTVAEKPINEIFPEDWIPGQKRNGSSDKWLPHEILPRGFASSYEKVICCGGGIDSTLAILYLKMMGGDTPLLIHTDYGIPYNKKEIESLKKVLEIFERTFDLSLSLVSVQFDSRLLGVPLTEENLGKGYIIPARNLLLSTIASNYGDDIWIVANWRKNDTVGAPDKSRKFYGDMTELLSLSWGSEKRVSSPFLHLSKKETIEWAINLYGYEDILELLSQTTSCYSEKINVYNCGECYACFKRWMATKGLIDLPFDKDPVEGKKFVEYASREVDKGRSIPDAVRRIFDEKQVPKVTNIKGE